MVLAETARPTGPRGQKDVLVRDFPLAARGNLFLQEVDQAARSEDCGAAGSHVDQFFAGVQVVASNVRERFCVVLHVVQGALNKPLVFPGEAAVKNRNFVTLLSLKWSGPISRVMVDRQRQLTDGC